ncbi:MAG TPA: sigma-70 family RNA polymerase sigma factor [Labilithrix sp.]|nr:sigma-70 family RNA polymerase sigma factor [Labilithrix sp.]
MTTSTFRRPIGASFAGESSPAAGAAETSEARYARIVQQQFDFVWRSLRGLGVPSDRVDDAAQNVFLLLHRHLADVDPSKERPYLFSVARGVASNERRMRARAADAVPSEVLEAIADTTAGPEAALEKKQARRLLDAALDALDDDLRVVFMLFELEGLPMPAIAETIGIPVGTVASRLRRARAAFAESCSRMQRDLERGRRR